MREPVIKPFRAVRYDERVAGDLGKLLAPPYDVSSPDLIAQLLGRSPLNMTHLEHVRPDPGENPHELAAERYRQWQADGVLRRDREPALYRYDHTYTLNGQRRTRRGIFAAVQLASWEDRVILPHERTFPGPVAERLGRLRAVGANLSPVYLLADDPSGAFRQVLAADSSPLLAETTDPDGESHRLTRIDDPATSAELARIIAGSRLFVADGHHRYEAALAFRDEQRATAGPAARRAGSEFVLALIADAADPNVVILPTHRVVQGLPGFDPVAIRRRLSELFQLEPWAAPAHDPGDCRDHQFPAGGDTVSLIRFAGEEGWWRLSLKPMQPHAPLMPSNRSEAWHQLPAAILEAIVFQHILGIAPGDLGKHVAFTHETDAAIGAIEAGSAQIAFLLPPSSVADLIAVANAGDRMPPKSTYFSPKVPAGLVVYDFAES